MSFLRCAVGPIPRLRRRSLAQHGIAAIAAQCKRVLEYLKSDGQTTYSLRAKGISHPAQRVKELVRLGYSICSDRVTAVDSDGFSHVNVARYCLMDREPDLVDMMEAA